MQAAFANCASAMRGAGAAIFLPAGPDYALEGEIKNVVTAVAKTYHYWTEHRSARESATSCPQAEGST